MADFNTHIFGAAAVVSLGATCCTKLLSLGVAEGLMLTVAGMVGGILPDIDLKQSQPSRALFTALGTLAALAWMFASIQGYTALELWLGAIAVYVLVRFPLWWLFHSVTTHRGILHSLIAAIMAGVLMCALAWRHLHTTELLSWLLGLFMTAGYIIHLVLDELVSVDFTGVRIKRSFGSALKVLDMQQLPASCLVIFITLVGWFWTAPLNAAWDQWQSLYTDWRPALLPHWL
ncbi:MAG: hydrolase [Granulosicoccus sp.]|nr:hydrolase [Granulosicoccus sp.]